MKETDFEPLELDRFLPYRLSVLTLSVSRSLASLYSDRFNLKVHEWRVMASLGCGEPLAAHEICSRINMDKVQVSRAVSGLLAAGLVTRKIDSQDRRRSSLWLSEKGWDVYKTIVPLAMEHETRLLDAFTVKEREQFNKLLVKLTDQALQLQNDT